MRLARNMAAGMANSVVVVLINLVALPFYLRLLGMEAYGLIGFYATLQTVLQVLDLGLAPTVSRELAHNTELGQQRASATLLRTLGRMYLLVALAIAVIIAAAAPWIAAHWLQAQQLPAATVAQAIALMGLNLACRWPISLYHNALVGSHRLALSSAVSMTTNISAAVVSILVLAYGTRSVQAFFVVQAVFGLIQALTLRTLARRIVGHRDAPADWGVLRGVWAFSAWAAGIGITALCLTQIDKVVLSRLLPLDRFGQYTLAAMLVSGFQVLTTPAFNALFPKFSSLVARRDRKGLEYLYFAGTRLYAAPLFALAFGLALHAGSFLTLWLKDPALAASVAPLVAWLAVGSALNGVMYLPYALQLATGHARLAFLTNLAMLALMVPMLLVQVARHGALGGAQSWAMLGVFYLGTGTWLTGRIVSGFAGWPWLRRHVAIPFAATCIPALIAACICRSLGTGPWGCLGMGAVAGIVGIALSLAISFAPGELSEVVAMALGRQAGAGDVAQGDRLPD